MNLRKRAVRYWSIPALSLCLLIILLSIWYVERRDGIPREDKFWTQVDRSTAQAFLDSPMSDEDRYSLLFRYFVTGFMKYRTPDSAHAKYYGASSSHGAQIDAMEGFTRVMPLISAWISSGRPQEIRLLDGKSVNLLQILKDGLIAGTDDAGPGYWGHIGDFDQKTCEAADIAISLWLVRDSLWPLLSASEKQKVMTWLDEVNDRRITDNNWHLFPVVVGVVLRSFGYTVNEDIVQMHYNRFKSFYRGDGWFSDGPSNIYDYYNAWSMHYTLFWITRIDPDFDRRFINNCLTAFLKSYQYFFAPNGFPIMGRSICYRMAAPAPLIAGVLTKPRLISPGLARRSVDCVWRYFIGKSALLKGNVTQGYCRADVRFLDNYSGAASCLWSLRSLVLAFYCPNNSPFWTAPLERLPVEQSDFSINIPSIRRTVVGFKASREVRIKQWDITGDQCAGAQGYTVEGKVAEMVKGRPHRPENTCVKYRLPEYSSSVPFCGCAQ